MITHIFYYRVSHKKVYPFETHISSQAPNIAQKKFSTRNESMDILFSKIQIQYFVGFLFLEILREYDIILIFQDKVYPLLTLQK